jgi:hypothetical protein
VGCGKILILCFFHCVCAGVDFIPLLVFVQFKGRISKCFEVLDSKFLFYLRFFVFFFPSFSPLDSVVDGRFEEG